MKKEIIIFTNNERSINIIKKLNHKYEINLIVLSKKFLTKKLISKIKKFKKKIIYFENSKKLLTTMINKKPDFILCCGFPKKISKEIIGIPKYCAINIHGGKFPNYLGGSPLNWQIINGENKIFISSIKMNEKIDGGPLILQRFFKIKKTDNLNTIKSKANWLFPNLCIDSINHIIQNKKLTNFSIKQKKFWKQRSKKDSKINLSENSKLYAHNTIRASCPKNYPEFNFIKKKKIYLFNSKFLPKNFEMSQKYKLTKKKLYLRFFDGFLLIDKFKMETNNKIKFN